VRLLLPSPEETKPDSLYPSGCAPRGNDLAAIKPEDPFERLLDKLLTADAGSEQAVEHSQLYEPLANHVDSIALSLSRFIFKLAQELRP
jgi:hypothetical protein